MSGRWRGEGAQHQGSRAYQEDSWALKYLADHSLLAVLADGMGGHVGGAVASKLAVDAAIAVVSGGGSLADALNAANRAIGEKIASDPQLDSMGATLVVTMVTANELHWISVGDSPLYLVMDGAVERLNADHSMAPQIDALVARGVITAAQAAHHPGRHTLREAVMGSPLSLIDRGCRRLGAGAVLLLCSDGVESLDHSRIATVASKPAQALVEAVLAVGAPHQDNVTVIKLEREE
ncbi:MAG: serine/threonine-protein phosphatase [Enhydrobacter sp.]|nr:serine/threonine-protein phosphatase [Enhydrobacter sp.]